VPTAVAEGLKRRGVDAISARDAGNLGLTDEQQLIYASENELPLFTHDADFLQLAHHWAIAGLSHWGINYVHQQKLSMGECIRRLKILSDLFDADDLRNHIEFL
jgi:hypothetical protein